MCLASYVLLDGVGTPLFPSQSFLSLPVRLLLASAAPGDDELHRRCYSRRCLLSNETNHRAGATGEGGIRRMQDMEQGAAKVLLKLPRNLTQRLLRSVFVIPRQLLLAAAKKKNRAGIEAQTTYVLRLSSAKTTSDDSMAHRHTPTSATSL